MKTTNIATALLALAALASVMAASPASAQVNCGMARDPAARADCQRRLMEIYQGESRAHDEIDRDLQRTERFYRGVDGAMRAGTYVYQQYTGHPTYDAYDAGRAAGEVGYELWNRR